MVNEVGENKQLWQTYPFSKVISVKVTVGSKGSLEEQKAIYKYLP